METTGGPVGRYDEFLANELDAAKRSGGKPALAVLSRRLADAKGLKPREAREVVVDYGARQCPEHVGSLAARPLKLLAWFMVVTAMFQTVLVVLQSSRTALSVSVPVLTWGAALSCLVEAYWAKGDTRRDRVVWGLAAVSYLALAVWLFCGPQVLERAFGVVILGLAVWTASRAARRR